ncbi:MAG: CBS domain-containing protein [Mariprofundus sp.]
MKAQTVQDLTLRKLVTTRGEESLHAAAERMRSHYVSVLLVLDGRERPVSILMEADLTHALAMGQDLDQAQVKHCLTHQALLITADTAVYDAMDLLLEKEVRHETDL